MNAAPAVSPRGMQSLDNKLTRRSVSFGATCAFIFVAAARVLHGQTPAEPPVLTFSAGAAVAASTPATEIRLLVGRSTLVNVGLPITRVSLTTADIADAMVTTPQQLLVHGKAPGTISLLVWDRTGAISSYEVIVERDLSALVEQVRQLFPGEPISVAGNGKDVVLAGTVSSKYVVEKAAEVATGYVDKKENVVNLLRQEEGAASTQIMLRVRFAEVSRNAMQELGASLFSDGNNNVWGRSTTQQFPAPFFDQKVPDLGKAMVFSDYLNLFLFDAKNQIGAVIKALSNKGLFQSLAEPNLIAQNGKEASFLAGGEYPYPAVQGAAGSTAVTIEFKEYGIRLNFTPTLMRDDIIHLKVRPEVSSLDFANAVTIEGFRVPSLATRRADTEVELRDGQTFAIAGLLSNTLTETLQKVPGIGDIPILGLLFRSKAMQKAETELIVMITPQILRRNSTGVSSTLPLLDKPFLAPPKNRIPAPPPYVPGDPRGAAMAAPGPVIPAPATQAPAPARPASVASAAPEPVPASVTPSEPAQAAAVMPVSQTVSEEPAPAPAPITQTVAVAPGPPTAQEKKALQAQQEAARKAQQLAERDAKRKADKQAEADAKAAKAAAQAREAADRKAAEDKKREDKIARERGKLQAEADLKAREGQKKAAEAAKLAEAAAKRQQNADAKALSEANERFRAAQAAYQADVDRIARESEAKNAASKPKSK